MERFTYAQLKSVLDSLTPEQLAMPAKWCGEERGGSIDGVWILAEDNIDADGDGIEPLSGYENDPDFEQIKEDGILYPKGTVFLMTDGCYAAAPPTSASEDTKP